MKNTNFIINDIRRNGKLFIEQLSDFIRFSSISAHQVHAHDVKKCADWLADHLNEIGLEHAKVIQTEGHPIVYADWLHARGLPTILIYGHYDVSPIDPVEEWRFPAFKPQVIGNSIYGRGASDDKGQMFAHLKALESYLYTTGSLPVNVICLFEGEEEIGSPNLGPFLSHNKSRLAADVALISDTAIPATDRPAITYSLRGALSLELEVRGPGSELHSGVFGGAVHNPLQVLCEIIARLHDAKGRVTIPGFYDRVRPYSIRERTYMKRSGPSDEDLLRNAGVQKSWGETGYSLYERTTIRPALTINGLAGGYAGEGSKAVIPSRAMSKLNFRLVPDQQPKDIDRLFRQYIASIAPPTVTWDVRTQSQAECATVDRTHPAVSAAVLAYRKGFGAEPVFLRSGGTIPVVNLLQEQLGIPTVLMGFGLPDDRIHSPNERLHLPNFFKGIATSIHFLAEMGELCNGCRIPRNRSLVGVRHGFTEIRRGTYDH